MNPLSWFMIQLQVNAQYLYLYMHMCTLYIQVYTRGGYYSHSGAILLFFAETKNWAQVEAAISRNLKFVHMTTFDV